MSLDVDLAVVGAGPAGLAAAVRGLDLGREVAVLEARDEAGGWARTEVVEGFVVEWGPHTLPASATATFALADRVGVGDELVPARAASRRWVVRGGRMHEVFADPVAFARSPLLSDAAKRRLFAEPAQPRGTDPDESIHAFASRRLGPEVADILVGAFVGGIYAGDAHRLSVRAAFPTLYDLEQRSGSLLGGALRSGAQRSLTRLTARFARGTSPEDAEQPGLRRTGIHGFARGSGRLTQAIAHLLGDRLHLDAPVQRLEPLGEGWRVHHGRGTLTARRVVVAVPPPAFASLLEPLDPGAAAQARAIDMGPVALVHLGGFGLQPPEGFGVLVPRTEPFQTLGVLFPSRLFPERTPPGGWLVSAFVGGATNPRALDRDDDDLVRTAIQEIARFTGWRPDPTMTRVLKHRAAIPQYTAGHLERVAAIRAAMPPSLPLAGNWLDGVAVDKAVQSGQRAAEGRP